MDPSDITRVADTLGGGQLLLQFEPIVDAQSGATRALETLARWRAEDGETHSAGWMFQHLGGDPDLIHDLDRWVVRRMLEERASFTALGTTRISINQHAQSVSIEAVRAVVDLCAGRDDAPIAVELFEHLDASQLEAMPAIAEELTDAGIEVWHDDFGTGERTLAHLIALPSTTVKLCPELVALGATSGRVRRHLRSVIAMLHNLGKVVIAEGVTDAEDAEWIADAGADWLQGRHHARPMVAAEAAQWLEAREQDAA